MGFACAPGLDNIAVPGSNGDAPTPSPNGSSPAIPAKTPNANRKWIRMLPGCLQRTKTLPSGRNWKSNELPLFQNHNRNRCFPGLRTVLNIIWRNSCNESDYWSFCQTRGGQNSLADFRHLTFRLKPSWLVLLGKEEKTEERWSVPCLTTKGLPYLLILLQVTRECA